MDGRFQYLSMRNESLHLRKAESHTVPRDRSSQFSERANGQQIVEFGLRFYHFRSTRGIKSRAANRGLIYKAQGSSSQLNSKHVPLQYHHGEFRFC
jgi:hypothetical protein